MGVDIKVLGGRVTEAAGDDPAGGRAAVAAATGGSKTNVDSGRAGAVGVAMAVATGPDATGVSGWPHASKHRRLRDRAHRPR